MIGLSSGIARLFDYVVACFLPNATRANVAGLPGGRGHNAHESGESAATMPPVSKSVSASQAPLTAGPGVRSGASSGVDSADRSGPLRSSGLVTDPVDGRVARALRLRQERSTQLLAVARRLFAKRRYHQTSIQDILEM